VQPSTVAQPPQQTQPAHDVFEQMGRNMSYANAFHLPAMELRKRFDDIEREISLEETRAPAASVNQVALDLTDDDVNESLRNLTPAAPIDAPPPFDATARVSNAPPAETALPTENAPGTNPAAEIHSNVETAPQPAANERATA
jgi:hypothetical protein